MTDLVRVWFVVMFGVAITGLAVSLAGYLLWRHFRERREQRRDEQYWRERLQRNSAALLMVWGQTGRRTENTPPFQDARGQADKTGLAEASLSAKC